MAKRKPAKKISTKTTKKKVSKLKSGKVKAAPIEWDDDEESEDSDASIDSLEKNEVAEKALRGRPRYVRDEKLAEQVKTLAGLGLSQEEIRQVAVNPETGRPIAKPTLAMYYRQELLSGKPLAVAKMAASLFKKGMGSGAQSVAASIFFLKAVGKWRDQPEVISVEVKSGVLVVPNGQSPTDWVDEVSARAEDRPEPGKSVE